MSAEGEQPRQESANSHPSLIGGHAKYLSGLVKSTLGYEAGEDQKRSAISEMRRASIDDQAAPASSPPMKSDILGTIEKKVGELTGCEALEKEGQQRMTQQAGAEEQHGTG